MQQLEADTDLIIKVDRIPEEGGRDLTGVLPASALQQRLGDQSDIGFVPCDPAELALHLEKIERAIRITGHVRCLLRGTCARCLGDADVAIDADVDMTLFPLQEDADASQVDETLDTRSAGDEQVDAASGTYDGKSFDVGDILRELLLLELPMRPLCRDDCAGLCDVCGANLNEGVCGCVKENMDPRWEALKQIKLS